MIFNSAGSKSTILIFYWTSCTAKRYAGSGMLAATYKSGIAQEEISQHKLEATK